MNQHILIGESNRLRPLFSQHAVLTHKYLLYVFLFLQYQKRKKQKKKYGVSLIIILSKALLGNSSGTRVKCEVCR